MNVICYKRVSTDDQADRGFSLQHQENMLKQFCQLHNHNVVGIYTEDYSAKDFDRPEWKKIMLFIKRNRGLVNMILCLRWDRYSRNLYDSLTMNKTLAKLGVVVTTIEQPLDLSNPDSKLLLNLYLTLPEIENDKNSIRTTEGSRRARIEGCWTGQAPKGYINYRDDKKSTLRPSPDAPLIVQAFERVATGAYSVDQVRKWLNGQGVPICKQVFLNTIRNPVYIGKIYVKPWKDQPSQISIGLHPPLISEEVFHKANEVLDGKKRNMKFHDDKSDIYPLKGFLKCPVHGTSLTAYACKSHTGKLHHYYLCAQDRCKQRHRVKDVHQSIEDMLSDITISAHTLNLYKSMLERIFDREDHQRKDEITRVKGEITKIESRKTNLDERFLDNEITSQDYHSMKEKVDKDMVHLRVKLNNLMDQKSPYKTYINKTIPMLNNIAEYYRSSNGETKKKILSCIFSEKIVLEKGRVATFSFTTPVRVLIQSVKVLEEGKIKQEVENDLLSCLAPLSVESCNRFSQLCWI